MTRSPSTAAVLFDARDRAQHHPTWAARRYVAYLGWRPCDHPGDAREVGEIESDGINALVRCRCRCCYREWIEVQL